MLEIKFYSIPSISHIKKSVGRLTSYVQILYHNLQNYLEDYLPFLEDNLQFFENCFAVSLASPTNIRKQILFFSVFRIYFVKD